MHLVAQVVTQTDDLTHQRHVVLSLSAEPPFQIVNRLQTRPQARSPLLQRQSLQGSRCQRHLPSYFTLRVRVPGAAQDSGGERKQNAFFIWTCHEDLIQPRR